jgi:elongation factor 1 alpha-like protein
MVSRYSVVILDAPGHQDFVPRMIFGAAQADAALLIIDGAPGGFESGFRVADSSRRQHAGQTREDTVDYDRARFADIQQQLKPFLVATGYKNVAWVPLAATAGENVVQAAQDSRLVAWWRSGSSLLGAIDQLQPARCTKGVSLALPPRLCVDV